MPCWPIRIFWGYLVAGKGHFQRGFWWRQETSQSLISAKAAQDDQPGSHPLKYTLEDYHGTWEYGPPGKGKDYLPNHHFQVLLYVNLRGCIWWLAINWMILRIFTMEKTCLCLKAPFNKTSIVFGWEKTTPGFGGFFGKNEVPPIFSRLNNHYIGVLGFKFLGFFHQWSNTQLAGGKSNIFYFHPENLWRWTQFDSYFSDGLKPPARWSFYPFFCTITELWKFFTPSFFLEPLKKTSWFADHLSGCCRK